MMDQYQEKLKEHGLSLRPHQISAVEKALSWRKQGHGGIIADEMGLGKTCEAISLIFLLTNTEKQRPHLVICPLSVIDHWEKELNRFGCGELKVIKFMGDLKERLKLRRQVQTSKYWNVMLTTYEYVVIQGSPIMKIHWSSLVFDEAQRIKNIDTHLHRAIRTLSVDWIVLMTGTPIQNTIRELFALLCIVDKTKFPIGSIEKFIKKYDHTEDNEVINELRTILSKYMIRRLKSEIAVEIPPSSQVVLYHGLSPMQKDLYKAILAKNYRFLMNSTSGQGGNRNTLLNIMMQLRKCTLHPYLFVGMEPEPFEEGEHLATSSGKMMLLDRLLVFLHKRKHRVLLFSQMTRMLDIVQDFFNFRGWSFERLDGGVKAHARFAAVDSFEKNASNVFCFLLSTRAGGLGLTLTGADTVIFIDSDFNPQNDIQAAARCHRIGQTKHVKIIRLITKNTVEEIVECYANRKLHMTNRIMDSDDYVKKEKLTAVEISNMILHGLRHLRDDSDSYRGLLTEKEIENIVGKTDAHGHWIDKKLDNETVQEPDENMKPVGGEMSYNAKEAPSLYVFEGHDYKKEQEALERIIEEAKKFDMENGGKVHQILRTKEDIDELKRKSLERQEKAKQERLYKMQKKRAKLWADNGYISTTLPLPDQIEQEAEEDVEDAVYYGPYFVHGDVTQPQRVSHDHSKHALIVHVVDNSGSFGHGGVFDALRAKSTRVVNAYHLAHKMNDLHIGDAHLIEDIDETEEYSNTESSANDGEESYGNQQCTSSRLTWTRKQSVVLLVAQKQCRRNEIRDKPFVECLTRLAAYAKSHDAVSVHLPRLGYGFKNINWYSLEHMIRRHLTEKQIYTYIYYHDGKTSAQGQNAYVPKKRGVTERTAANSADEDGSSTFQQEKTLKMSRTHTMHVQEKEEEEEFARDEKEKENLEEEEEVENLEEEQAEQDEEEVFEKRLRENENEEDCLSTKRRRMERIFEGMVIWIHALPKSERHHYATLIEDHGGDSIEEKEGTDLVTHVLFDEAMAGSAQELQNLKESLPKECAIVSKDWIDQSISIGNAVNIKSFLVQ